MKKFYANKLATVCILLFILSAWFSKSFVLKLYDAGISFFSDFNITRLIENVDNASKKISYKNALLDLNSYVMQISDVKKIKKEDMNVLRLDNEYLCYERRDISDELIKKAADGCIKLKNKADELDIPLLYIVAPFKLHFDENVGGYSIEDQEKFVSLLENENINVINIMDAMKNKGLGMEETFYITDHHWKTETGLWVSQLLCEELKKLYNFNYNEEYYQPHNFDVKVYEDIFLGSIGKKTGRFFTPLGVDDFSLITPKFDTQYIVNYKDKTLTGNFKETLLSLENIDKKDYYSLNPYATYCHGDFPILTIENELMHDDGKTFLIIKNSYANAVIPFFASSAKKLYVLDIREGIVGDFHKQSVFEYIEQFNPDYIMVLYSGVDISPDDESAYVFD